MVVQVVDRMGVVGDAYEADLRVHRGIVRPVRSRQGRGGRLAVGVEHKVAARVDRRAWRASRVGRWPGMAGRSAGRARRRDLAGGQPIGGMPRLCGRPLIGRSSG